MHLVHRVCKASLGLLACQEDLVAKVAWVYLAIREIKEILDLLAGLVNLVHQVYLV